MLTKFFFVRIWAPFLKKFCFDLGGLYSGQYIDNGVNDHPLVSGQLIAVDYIHFKYKVLL